MANTDLALRKRTLPGLLPAEEVDRLADGLAATLEIDDRSQFTMARLPSIAERQMLQKRIVDFEEALSGIGPGDTQALGGEQWKLARRALAALFASYPSLRNANVAEMLDTYLAWMQDRPAFAVAEACRMIGKGEAKWPDGEGGFEYAHKDHPPSVQRIDSLAAVCTEPHRDKLAQIEKVFRVKRVTPPAPTEAERARVGELMRELAASMKKPLEEARSDVEERQMAAAVAQHTAIACAAWRAEGYEPIFNENGGISSPGMLKSMGKWPPAEAKRVKKGGAK